MTAPSLTPGTDEAEFFLDNLDAPDELGAFRGTIALTDTGDVEVYLYRTGDDEVCCTLLVNWPGRVVSPSWEKDNGERQGAVEAARAAAVTLYARGWTQVAIARQLGVAQQSVSRYLADQPLLAPEQEQAISEGRRQRPAGGREASGNEVVVMQMASDPEQRGLTFAQLLLHVWPPCSRERRRSNAGLRVANILLAERIGVNLSTLEYWRLDKQLPRTHTIKRIAALLEAEFNVPAEIWLDAWEISATILEQSYGPWRGSKAKDLLPWQDFLYHLEEYQSEYGNLDVPSHYVSGRYPLGSQIYHVRSGVIFAAHITELNTMGFPWAFPGHAKPVAPQYGWIQVLSEGPPTDDRGHRSMHVLCLLCDKRYVTTAAILRGGALACKSCAFKLRHRGERSTNTWHSARFKWCASPNVKGTRRFRSRFHTQEDAARWADKITYEAYGHTIFLNFPEEYDQSNDPVFVPVK